MEVKGKIHEVKEIEVKSEKFKKREVVTQVEGGEYPRYVTIQLNNDNADKFTHNVGEEINFDCNIGSPLWTNKEGKEVAFNNIEAWRWELLQESTPENSTPSNNESEDLPF